MESKDDSNLIRETDLGQSVLTLNEVLLTFSDESAMFNIKLQNPLDDVQYRTVVLTKNEVEVEGENKLFIMIRDKTDQVSLAKEDLKKKKEKVSTTLIQKDLNEVFSQHCEEVTQLLDHIDQNENTVLKKLGSDLKLTNANLIVNFYMFCDVVNIQNDMFTA